ncbi:MAG: putative membrane protein YfcA, partial [Planctomycetota bacterium]
AQTHRTWALLLMIGAGFYGGFIQIGVGFLLITALLLGDRWAMAQAHAAKISIVGLYTAITLPVFILSGQIDWAVAGCLAIGQALGGYLGSRFATRVEEASLRKLYLVLMVVFAIVLMVR